MTAIAYDHDGKTIWTMWQMDNVPLIVYLEAAFFDTHNSPLSLAVLN
jgi:hypothetical protein